VTVTATDADSCTGSANYSLVVFVPPPVIGTMKKLTPFGIKVTGGNLQSGIRVAIDGTPWTSVVWKSATKVRILGGKSLKTLVPKGVSTTFVFTNPDDGQATFNWSW
jgi:hypothetical protein